VLEPPPTLPSPHDYATFVFGPLQYGRTPINAHLHSKVQQMVINIGLMPLIRAFRVLIPTARIQCNTVTWLVPLTGDVSETLMHWAVNNHIQVVSDATFVS
jgi:hypothetical protein